MNTMAEPMGKKIKYTPCNVCRLYHDTSKGCQFVDQKNKRFRVQKFLQHGNVRHILPSGDSIVSDYWIDKLKKYTFPALEIEKESDKAKIISELKKAAAELPRVTQEERKVLQQESKKMINIAMEGADQGALVELQEQLSVLTNQVQVLRSKSGKSSKGRKARKKSNREDNEEESSDSSDGFSTDASDYSH